MERVKRKGKKKTIRKSWILGLVLLVLAAAVGVFLHEKNKPVNVLEQLENLSESQEMNDIIQGVQENYVVRIPQEEVVSLSVFPREYTPYELVKEGESMKLAAFPASPLRMDVVEDILYAACAMQADTVIAPMDELADSPEEFGFDSPVLHYVIRKNNGEETAVLLGDRVPGTETELYFCLANGMLYTVLAEPCAPLFSYAEYLLDFSQPSLQKDLIDRIDVSGDVEISFRYTPDGFVMDAPVSYPVDQTRMNTLLTYVEHMLFEAYLGTAEENDLEALGLKKPCITVTLTQASSTITQFTADGERVTRDVPEQTYTLTLGHDTGRSGVYLGWEGGVYKGSDFLFGVWKELKAEDFYSLTPMNFPVDRLQSLCVETENEKAVYTVEMVESITENNQIATDEYGQILYDAQVKKDGVITDAEAFLNWYVQLNKLAVSGNVPSGAMAEREEIATLVFRTDATERKVVFLSFDALHAAMEVDGTAAFYLEKAALSLLDQLP